MIYADYLSVAEMQRWSLDFDIAWDAIDPELAHRDPALLQRLRDSALIESFFPIFTCRAMDLLWTMSRRRQCSASSSMSRTSISTSSTSISNASTSIRSRMRNWSMFDAATSPCGISTERHC